MTLHIINRTSSDLLVNEQLSHSIEEGDHVLLIEDGVTQCLTPSSGTWPKIAKLIYVLEDDAKARGIQIPEHFTSVSYNGFVNLTIEHTKVVSWY